MQNTPTAAPAARAYTVATNLACDRDTAELGEDHTELTRVAEAFNALEAAIQLARPKVHSARAQRTLRDLDEMLVDVRHDTSIMTTTALAKDAAIEARVVKAVRSAERA